MKKILGKGESEHLIPGPAGALEIRLYETEVPQARVVICHPHPTPGGSMDHKVITVLHKAFAESGFNTLRFNFRGTGKSEGIFDEGRGEQDDLRAVIDWQTARSPHLPLYLAGFSFGSFVSYAIAVSDADSNTIKQLVSIAPPVQYPEFHTLPFPPCPWLVVQGGLDDIVDAKAVEAWASQAPQVTLVAFPETGHFFHRQLADLQKAVQSHLILPA